MTRILTLLLAAIVAISDIWGQSYRLFTSDNELPSSMTNYIFQDRFGFIWIATENGLVKYDGARFITYTHKDSDVNSLAHDFVTSLAEDHDGNLYISTYAGIQVYNYRRNNFSPNVTWPDGSDFTENSNYLFCSSNNVVYSAGHSACRITYDGENVTAHKLDFSDQLKSYTKVQADLAGNLWVSINRQNILLRVRNGKIVKRYDFLVPNTYLNDFTVTPDGAVFASVSCLGTMQYNRASDSFELCLPYSQNKSTNSIYAQDDRIIILAEQNPVVIFDRKKKTTTHQNLDIGKSRLSELNPISYLFDKDGNTWIGIAQHGVLMLPAGNSPFNYVGTRSSDSNLIGVKPVSAICQDREGLYLIGTDGDGFYCLDEKMTTCYVHNSQPARVTSFMEDDNGDMLISSASMGIYKYDRRNRTFGRHTLKTEDCEITSVHGMQRDDRGRLWLGTMGKGLFCHDEKQNRTICVNDQRSSIHKWIDKVFISTDGYLWLGTFDGLERVNINSDSLENHRFIKRTIVYDIAQDNRQTLWLATSAGLFNMTTDGDTIQVFTTKDGLPSQSLASLQIDSDNNIWVSSNMGLSKVVPSSGNVVNFFSGDGLQGNEFSKKASACDLQGRLWFGGTNGITHFVPRQVQTDQPALNIRVVALTLSGEEVTTETLSDGKQVIEEPIYSADKVTLGHDDHAFTLFFATKELNCPQTMQFEYKLNRQSWQRLPVGVHSVSFSNLPTGANQFSVRAVQSQRCSSVCSLSIVILPAWYETWWARTSAVMLAVLMLALVFVAIRAHFREYNERMLAERQKAFHDAQTRLFIDITHELRTPLTLILGPVRKLIGTDSDVQRQSSYSTIQRNATRILRILEQMIDLRRMDKGVLTLHFEEKDLVETIANVYSDFREQALIKHIDFSFCHEGIYSLPVWIDTDYFDKIVINLVSNAMKYTPTGGKVTIRIMTTDNEKVSISVVDNGPGVPEPDRERIFDRFYRGNNAEASKIVGSGIGLSLTHSLVEMHHGSITLESSTEAPTGSTFTVTLPLGRQHLADSEIIEMPVVRPTQEENNHVEYVDNNETPVTARTKYHVLIVDDEDEIVRYLKQEFSTDFHVACACNGKEALSMLLNVHFDIVISDVMMPVMDGETLCRKIRQNININHLPVILLTANTQEESMIAGLDSGADEYLTKPVSINRLRRRIYNLLRSREMLRNNFSGKQLEEDKLDDIQAQTPDEQLMERVMREINNNISNVEFSVEMLASNVGLSRVHLNRKLKELTNQTPRDFIRNARLRQSAQLLEQGNIPMTQIAELVGFTSASNFTRAFQELYGVSPKEYKQNRQNR